MKSINYTARFIDLASEIDSTCALCGLRYKTRLTATKSLNGSKVLILGVAYKPNKRPAQIAAFDVIHLLQRARVSYYDPFVPGGFRVVRMNSERTWLPRWRKPTASPSLQITAGGLQPGL